jgi:hypothetical protein
MLILPVELTGTCDAHTRNYHALPPLASTETDLFQAQCCQQFEMDTACSSMARSLSGLCGTKLSEAQKRYVLVEENTVYIRKKWNSNIYR